MLIFKIPLFLWVLVWVLNYVLNLTRSVLIFLELLASNCSYPVLIFWPNLGYFWLYALILPIWPLICLKSRLRAVLKLFLFFGVFEPRCSYKIVLLKKECTVEPAKNLISGLRIWSLFRDHSAIFSGIPAKLFFRNGPEQC